MIIGNGKNTSNRNQGYLILSKPRSPTRVNPGYPNTTEKQNSDLKLHLMMMTEYFKKDINNSLQEIQDKTSKQVEVQKKKTKKNPLKIAQKHKHLKELEKTIQDLKVEK